MLSLSQSVGYAVQALACLEENPDDARLVKDIAEFAGVPAPYLSKLLKRLADADIVASKRGYKGGTWLARSPKMINLLEISEAIDGRKWRDRCLLGLEHCTDERACPTHDFWKKARNQIESKLRKTSLAEVIAFENKRRSQTSRRKAKVV